jgi:hypothetical protein
LCLIFYVGPSVVAFVIVVVIILALLAINI